MKQRLEIFIWTILFLLPFVAFGQVTNEYKNEEDKVINQFFCKFIGGDSLNAANKLDSLEIVYFDTKLACNLENEFYGGYKSNKFLKKLEKNYLGAREIDSLKIKKLINIKIQFENNVDYFNEKYESESAIGIINFSRISFNKSLTVGYFYYSIFCGLECGCGYLIKIKKKNGKWAMAELLASYVS